MRYFDERPRRRKSDLAIVGTSQIGGNDRYTVSDDKSFYARSHGLDHPGGLQAELRRQRWLDGGLAGPGQNFASIQADGFYAQANLLEARIGHDDVLDFQDIRASELVKSNTA